MKKVKAILVATAIMLTACFCLTACKVNNLTPTPPRLVEAESVEITNSAASFAPGEYELTAKVKPSLANQGVIYSLVGNYSGVSITEDKKNGKFKLEVGKSAINGLVISIKAASTYNALCYAVKKFSLSIPVIKGIEITTEAQLRAIDTDKESLSEAYVLMNDIALTSDWEPIGVAEFEDESGNVIRTAQPFNGIFDGNGYTISNINIDRASETNEQKSKVLGFFEQIGGTGEVKKVKLVGKINAVSWLGGIASVNQGIISNCISDIEVSGTTTVGALVSENRGRVENCYAIGKTVARNMPNSAGRSAGLFVTVGDSANCFGDKTTMGTPNYHTLTGAVVDSSIVMETEYMQQALTFKNYDTEIWNITNGNYPTLKNPDFAGAEDKPFISFTNRDKAIDVKIDSDYQLTVSISGVQSKTASFALASPVAGVSLNSQSGLLSFDKNSVVDLSVVTVVGTLQQSPQTTAQYSVKLYNDNFMETKIFNVANEEDLFRVATEERLLSGTINLTSNIVLNQYAEWVGIANSAEKPFIGTFNGNGYSISGLNSRASGAYGFIGFLGSSTRRAVVKNVSLSGTLGGSISWGGTLVGTILNGAVSNCFTNVNISTDGGLNIGGIVGTAVRNSNARVENSMSVGKMQTGSGTASAGAIAAGADFITISNCYTDTLSSGTNKTFGSGANAGTTFGDTVIMKTAGTFTALNASDWHKVNGNYPLLKNDANRDNAPLEASVICINNTVTAIDLYADKAGFQLTVSALGVSNTAVTFAFATPVAGASITDSGLITFDDTFTMGTKITAVVTHNDDSTLTSMRTFTTFTTIPVYISTQEELVAMKENPAGNYALKNDIQLTDANKNWVAFNFTGVFDGKGYTISGFDSSVGLFGEITAKTDTTVAVKNLRITGKINFNGAWQGGIAAKLVRGTIENCIVDVAFTATNKSGFGAIIGSFDDSTSNKGNAAIKNCLVLGSFGALPAGDGWMKNIGGIAGGELKGTISNVFYNSDGNGAKFDIADGVAFAGKKTEAQIKQATTFGAFDKTIWNVADGAIPTLKPQQA